MAEDNDEPEEIEPSSREPYNDATFGCIGSGSTCSTQVWLQELRR